MKRVSFPQEAAQGGTTRHRSKTDRGPGCRQFRAQLTIPACLFVGILLFSCETQTPSRSVGGGCQYRNIPGTCLFDSITPSGPNDYGEGFRTLFSFLPDSDQETSGMGMRMVIGYGKDPTKRYLAENRIEVGSKIRCVRRLRIRGPCSPEVFEFPDLKSVY
jgi:hypothetical protein